MARDQRADRVGRLCALGEPVLHALPVDFDDGGLGARIVVAEDFDEAAVARRARISDDDSEEWALLGTGPPQTNDNHRLLLMWCARPGPRAPGSLRLVRVRDDPRRGAS